MTVHTTTTSSQKYLAVGEAYLTVVMVQSYNVLTHTHSHSLTLTHTYSHLLTLTHTYSHLLTRTHTYSHLFTLTHTQN